MNVEIVTLDDRALLGVSARFEPGVSDHADLRYRYFDPRAGTMTALTLDTDFYRVYYGTGQGRWSDYMMGMLAPNDVNPPYGLIARPLPGGTYARFDCTVGSLSATWASIYDDWMPASGYSEDESRPSWEVMPGGAPPDDSPASIFVPVTEKP